MSTIFLLEKLHFVPVIIINSFESSSEIDIFANNRQVLGKIGVSIFIDDFFLTALTSHFCAGRKCSKPPPTEWPLNHEGRLYTVLVTISIIFIGRIVLTLVGRCYPTIAHIVVNNTNTGIVGDHAQIIDRDPCSPPVVVILLFASVYTRTHRQTTLYCRRSLPAGVSCELALLVFFFVIHRSNNTNERTTERFSCWWYFACCRLERQQQYKHRVPHTVAHRQFEVR